MVAVVTFDTDARVWLTPLAIAIDVAEAGHAGVAQGVTDAVWAIGVDETSDARALVVEAAGVVGAVAVVGAGDAGTGERIADPLRTILVHDAIDATAKLRVAALTVTVGVVATGDAAVVFSTDAVWTLLVGQTGHAQLTIGVTDSRAALRVAGAT